MFSLYVCVCSFQATDSMAHNYTLNRKSHKNARVFRNAKNYTFITMTPRSAYPHISTTTTITEKEISNNIQLKTPVIRALVNFISKRHTNTLSNHINSFLTFLNISPLNIPNLGTTFVYKIRLHLRLHQTYYKILVNIGVHQYNKSSNFEDMRKAFDRLFINNSKLLNTHHLPKLEIPSGYLINSVDVDVAATRSGDNKQV